MIAVLLNDGFEEIEALCPVDMLRRAGADVRTVGLDDRTVHGAHGINVLCDMTAEELDTATVTAVILPGGMPGAAGLDSSAFTDRLLREVYARGGHLAAICAAPMVLGHRGYLSGKAATCFPGFEGHLQGATLSERPVITDGRITTARSVYAAMDFAEELVRVLVEEREDA